MGKVIKFKPGYRRNPPRLGAAAVYQGRQMMPHEYLVLKNSRKPLSTDDILKLTVPLLDFSAGLKNGTADDAAFQRFIDTGYNLLHLIEVVLEKRKLSDDPAEEDTLRGQLANAHIVQCEHLSDLILSIGERQRRTGKYGATADELKLLDSLRADWVTALQLVDYGDWFESLQRSQRALTFLRRQAANDKEYRNEQKQ